MSDYKCPYCNCTESHQDLHYCEVDTLQQRIEELEERVKELEKENNGLFELSRLEAGDE